MKKIFIIIAIALSLNACNAQDAQLNEAKQKLEQSQADLSNARALLDTVKFKYEEKLSQYSDTVKRLEDQVKAYEILLADCPDTNLVNDLFKQKARLEIQIANMKIEEQNSYNLMLKFQELSDAWLKAYEKAHPDAEFLKE
jgi:septal ring factor EnvC (AmiA/AmiB activator)